MPFFPKAKRTRHQASSCWDMSGLDSLVAFDFIHTVHTIIPIPYGLGTQLALQRRCPQRHLGSQRRRLLTRIPRGAKSTYDAWPESGALATARLCIGLLCASEPFSINNRAFSVHHSILWPWPEQCVQCWCSWRSLKQLMYVRIHPCCKSRPLSSSW